MGKMKQKTVGRGALVDKTHLKMLWKGHEIERDMCADFVNAFAEAVSDLLADGYAVTLRGLVTLNVRKKAVKYLKRKNPGVPECDLPVEWSPKCTFHNSFKEKLMLDEFSPIFKNLDEEDENDGN